MTDFNPPPAYSEHDEVLATNSPAEIKQPGRTSLEELEAQLLLLPSAIRESLAKKNSYLSSVDAELLEEIIRHVSATVSQRQRRLWKGQRKNTRSDSSANASRTSITKLCFIPESAAAEEWKLASEVDHDDADYLHLIRIPPPSLKVHREQARVERLQREDERRRQYGDDDVYEDEDEHRSNDDDDDDDVVPSWWEDEEYAKHLANELYISSLSPRSHGTSPPTPTPALASPPPPPEYTPEANTTPPTPRRNSKTVTKNNSGGGGGGGFFSYFRSSKPLDIYPSQTNARSRAGSAFSPSSSSASPGAVDSVHVRRPTMDARVERITLRRENQFGVYESLSGNGILVTIRLPIVTL